ncbi:FadR family transcriptional regulator [Frankia sp. AgB1.9]|uniref:FadR/GntR family transcriptional regulator n=1 Tax=unclassified Frankia TaxID=2632575 RepID=UPI001933F548|nr:MULTISPECIES: GntR family transcriptional regulator [unclassified Frankia]MBL7488216.1 FadR family transcriptional regulator [Frankia sp. AgW1.1]MBL7548141.1 FadR family transcriptional regulator [Frankia sp. AgB1.9]MBL7620367.1 FadR family transcriptional regulator [Frankia sp. AgB1.8]
MPPSRRRPISAPRVAETIAATLRERILASTAGDAYRLPTQEQLVEEFGVSYPSVREALRILETEGLVTVRRGNVGGGEVHRPDSASSAYHLGLVLQAERVTLGDLAGGLRLFEPLCAAECARRTDRLTAVVPILRANIETSVQLVGAEVAFTQTAREFHELVVALTPNATVRTVVSSLVALWSAQEVRWAELLTSQGRYPAEHNAQAVVRTHRRILAEIEAGRAAEAERIARAHLAATQALLVDRFDDDVVNAASAKLWQSESPGNLSRPTSRI